MTGADRDAQVMLDWVESWSAGKSSESSRPHETGPSEASGPPFAAVALDRFRRQFSEIDAYRAFCVGRGVTPNTVAGWRSIPLVPVTAFKSAAMQSSAALRQPVAVFETSGTTDGRPGIVRLADTAVYDRAAIATFARFVLPDNPGSLRCVELVPRAAERPRSSLGHMVQLLVRHFGDGRGAYPIQAEQGGFGLRIDAMLDALRTAIAERCPVLLFTTTVALARLISRWPAAVRLTLPCGSRVMDTGGSKGVDAPIDRAAQRRWLGEHLAVAPTHVVGELGMTELCSQRYETTLLSTAEVSIASARAYAGPPWLRSRVLDPLTMTDAPVGAVGMVAHLDLANMQTCAFVLTGDLGRHVRVRGAGLCLELLGRATDAELRGCGLDARDL